MHDGHRYQRESLHEHARGDEPLAADAITQCPSEQLPQARRPGIHECQEPDLAERKARNREKEWEEAPRQTVVEVVDESRLTRAGKGRISPTHEGHESRCAYVTNAIMASCCEGCLVRNVMHGVAHE